MKDIAVHLGVSTSTVSLVLNNRDAGRVKSDIADKVRRTAREMGYRPNTLARSLRTSKTRIIGFISDEIATTPYAGRLILGAQDAARSMDYMLLTANTNGDPRLEEHEVDALKQYSVKGFLYARMFNQPTSIPGCLRGCPIVLVDGTDPTGTVPSIIPDEVSIGYDGTRHLVESGCRRIAYIGNSEQVMMADIGRQEGYRKALAESGIPYDEHLVISVDYNQRAQDAVNRLFESQHPDGVMCFNDARAWYVYFCAARMGLTIGRDVSVVGVDNHRVSADTMAPPLTTVDLPHYEMGYWGAMKLLTMIEDIPEESVTLPQTTSRIPPLSEHEAKIHCRLLRKQSVIPRGA